MKNAKKKQEIHCNITEIQCYKLFLPILFLFFTESLINWIDTSTMVLSVGRKKNIIFKAELFILSN